MVPVFVPLTETLLVDIVLDMEKVERGQPMSLPLKNDGEEFVIQHEIQHKSRKDKVDRKIHFFDCAFSNGWKKPFPINAFV